MDKNVCPNRSFLTHRKTKTQKIIARILEEEPDKTLKPSMGERQGNLNPKETPSLKDFPLKEDPKKFDLETVPKAEEALKATERPLREPYPSSGLPVLPEEDEMNDGYIKLWRKLRQSRVWENPRLLKVWLWCLFKANYKESWVTVKTGRGTTEVKLSPGQFIFGRKTAARELKMKPSSVRNFMQKLRNFKNLDIKQDTQQDTHYSIVSINNWQTYQGAFKKLDTQQDTQEDRQRTGKGHREEGKERREKKPSAISEEIASLVSKIFSFPGGEETYSKLVKAISETRKTKKLSPGVILSLLQSLEKFPQEKIQAGIRIYLEKAHHTEGKAEKYLLGIIRNHRTEETKVPPKGDTGKGEDLAAARRRKMEAAEPVPCPPDLRPEFMKERET